MTAKEAIAIIKEDLHEVLPNACVTARKHNEAIIMAIKALGKQIPKKIENIEIDNEFKFPNTITYHAFPCCGIDTPNPINLEGWQEWNQDCGQYINGVIKTMRYWDNITRIYEKQCEKGLREYGQTLEENQLPEVLTRIQYIEEELVDALMYLEWLKDGIEDLMEESK